MRILVFSDTHGHPLRMCDLIELHKPAMVLHLGDYLRDAEYAKTRFPEIPFRAVAGNGDALFSSSWNELFEVEGKTIFMTHGHNYGVKSGIARLLEAAKEKEADIVLFGHTHRQMEAYKEGIYVLNPGSLTLPDGAPGYGIIDITSKEVLCIAAKA